MRIKMMWIRILTASVLFLILAQVNVWADTRTHLVLAAGYRAFLICAPLFMSYGLSVGMRSALALSALATVGALVSVNEISMTFLAIGMAVSGYIAKFIAAHTSQGAADNKVSLNIGSLVSGLLLMTMTDKTYVLLLSVILLLIAVWLSLDVDWDKVGSQDQTALKRMDPGHKKRTAWVPLFGWGLIGVATGIKLTGIFVILPQYLIATTGELPRWFGALVIVNSLIVVAIQHSVLRALDRLPTAATFLVSLSAMLLLAMPVIFRCESVGLSFIWVALLTLGECALSRYDRIARDAGYLFPKELMVGIGSFATVWLSRSFPYEIHWSGILGVVCLGLGVVLTSGRVKVLRLSHN